MARTLETVQAELDALLSAYAKGILEVEFADQRTRYDSEAAMRRRIAYLQREVATLGGSSVTRYRHAVTSKGV